MSATGTSLDLPPLIHMTAGLWYCHEEIILRFPKGAITKGRCEKKIKLYLIPPKVTALRRFQPRGFRLLVEDLFQYDYKELINCYITVPLRGNPPLLPDYPHDTPIMRKIRLCINCVHAFTWSSIYYFNEKHPNE